MRASVRPDLPAEPAQGGVEEPRMLAERVLVGLPAAGGVVIGPAYVYEREEVYVTERALSLEEVDAELQLLGEALERANRELTKIIEFAQAKLDSDASAIFEMQIMLLNDVELGKALERRIREERKNADFLIHQEFERYKAMLLRTNNPLFSERTADLDDVAQRLLRALQKKRLHANIEGKHVVIADVLTPADTVLFLRNDVLGYATNLGGITSHAAILARSLKVPAVVGAHDATETIRTGDTVILDGQLGRIILHPSPETIAEYRGKIDRIHEIETRLEKLVGLPCVTPDGHKVELSANAEFVNEVEYVLAQGSKGIGLYRTEHLSILEGEFPSEQEQYVAYSSIAQSMYPQSVIIRTFDLGGDKFMVQARKEDNPSLGWRGIRVMLDKPEEFRAQLRAILRASVTGNIKIMFPMISGLAELREARAHFDAAKAELQAQGCPFDDAMEVGIMIEVPSAVLLADVFARAVDFFSIGTNDLVQYLLAVDRNNDLITNLYQEFHPSVIRAIKHVIDTAHAHGKWVGLCGEMGGNPLGTILLLGLGLDEFSMVPSMIPTIKGIIRETRYEDAKNFAEEVLRCHTTAETKRLLASAFRERFPHLASMYILNGAMNT